MIDERPLPVTDDPADAPMWEAALRGELVVQACVDCGRLRFPPRPMCPDCQSLDTGWQKLSGRGQLWSYCVAHPPLLPAFEKDAPYNVAVIQLDEAPTLRIFGRVVRGGAASGSGEAREPVDPSLLVIGARLQVVFEKVADDVALPLLLLEDDLAWPALLGTAGGKH